MEIEPTFEPDQIRLADTALTSRWRWPRHSEGCPDRSKSSAVDAEHRVNVPLLSASWTPSRIEVGVAMASRGGGIGIIHKK